MSNFTPTVTGTGARARIQRFGGFLSGMVMPNIGAFIAFGFITALFIPDGWTPNADLAEMVGPMIVVLIPTLVAYTGGKMVHGQRGAVIGAVAIFGAIVAGADPIRIGDGALVLPFGGQVMILGAFILGPLSAYLLKLFDNLVADRVKAGFEMLIDNFSIGILGAVMAIFGYKVIEPDGRLDHRPTRGRGRDPGQQQPAPAFVGHHRAGEGPVPQQCDQPRCSDASRRSRGPGTGQVDPVHAGGQPRTRCRAAARVPVLRPPVAAPDRPGRTDHPVLRWHPRDLLPVRADATQDRFSPPSPAVLPGSRSSRRSTWASPARPHPAASSPSWA